MWKEILNNSGILALIGVFIGFFLSEITNIFKKNKKIVSHRFLTKSASIMNKQKIKLIF